jgi:hypothetical protein
MRTPRLSEDVRNLALIGGAGLAGLVFTAGFVMAVATANRVERTVHVTRVVERTPVEMSTPVDGSNRIWGTVTTRRGTHTGFIRWDKNEGSWADLLDANKVTERRTTDAGIRFGNITRLDRIRDGALLTLRNGDVVRMGGGSTDLGPELRALTVIDPNTGWSEYDWRDLESIEFASAPPGTMAGEGRLYGTLTTRDGVEFTGYLTWDVDEIFTTDVLDGEVDGREVAYPFGEIAEIHRQGRDAARVVLRDGAETTLSGTNDVNSSIRGISVSDPGLGQVLLTWDDFESVRLHPAEAEVGYESFQHVGALEATVETESGERVRGALQWDRDEAAGWELLNGDQGDIEFSIEFSKIAGIEKTSRGARATLLDGRTFELSGSNDVDSGNRGIVIEADGETRLIGWSEFRSLRIES